MTGIVFGPVKALPRWQSIKIVRAGEIAEVTETGCYVREANGELQFRAFVTGMTARYTPKIGDFWVVYDGEDGQPGYESLSPRAVFRKGYVGAPPE